jgi:hypothetical protein
MKGVKTIPAHPVADSRLKVAVRGPNKSSGTAPKHGPGSFGAMLEFAEAHGTHQMAGNELLQKSIEERSAVKEDPWT